MEDLLINAIKEINRQCQEYSLGYHYEYEVRTEAKPSHVVINSDQVAIRIMLYAVEDIPKGRRVPLIGESSVVYTDRDGITRGKSELDQRFFTSIVRILLLGKGSPLNVVFDDDKAELSNGLKLIE